MMDVKSRLRSDRGLISRIAKTLRITQSAVSQWDIVPPRRVLEVERISGIPRHHLNPDCFPPPEADHRDP